MFISCFLMRSSSRSSGPSYSGMLILYGVAICKVFSRQLSVVSYSSLVLRFSWDRDFCLSAQISAHGHCIAGSPSLCCQHSIISCQFLLCVLCAPTSVRSVLSLWATTVRRPRRCLHRKFLCASF